MGARRTQQKAGCEPVRKTSLSRNQPCQDLVLGPQLPICDVLLGQPMQTETHPKPIRLLTTPKITSLTLRYPSGLTTNVVSALEVCLSSFSCSHLCRCHPWSSPSLFLSVSATLFPPSGCAFSLSEWGYVFQALNSQ